MRVNSLQGIEDLLSISTRVSTMSPNTCKPCLRSIQGLGVSPRLFFSLVGWWVGDMLQVAQLRLPLEYDRAYPTINSSITALPARVAECRCRGMSLP